MRTIREMMDQMLLDMTAEEVVKLHFPTAFIKCFKDGKEVGDAEAVSAGDLQYDYCALYAEHPDTGEEFELLSDSGIAWSGNPHGEGCSTESTTIDGCWDAAVSNLPFGYFTGDFTGPL